MLHKPAHLIFYLSTLQKPAAGAGFCNVLKYKADTFYLSTIQKPAPGNVIILADTDVGDVAHTERHYGISRLYYQYSYISIYTISNMLELCALDVGVWTVTRLSRLSSCPT